ncbi:MAG: T9SS type B sorting domain-containing protein, partial [Chitinophagaceae bacterium]|nr:T9SS type B sorting domain-containing protein [Chitinophagaceae bacterium]
LTISNVLTTVPTCNPGNDATATISVIGGTPAYTYSINGINFQNSNIITALDVLTYTITVKDANQCTQTSVFNVDPPPTPILTSVSTSQASCVPGCNGSLSVNAIGGTAPLQYQINNGPLQNNGQFNALCIGNYTVVVSDANACTQASIASINTTTPPQITNTTINDVLCFGGNTGSVSLQVNSIATPVTYVLMPGNVTSTNPSFNNLSAGTYTITGTDINGCSVSTIVSINQPPVLSIATLYATPAICNNGASGTIYIQVNGGAGSINLSVLPSVGNVLSPGLITNLPGNQTYTVTATDVNGCTITGTVFVGNPPPITFTQVSNTNVTCYNAANAGIQVQATGGTGSLTYTLQPGSMSNASGIFNGLSGNAYTITVSDANNCSTTTVVTVLEPNALQWTLTQAIPITCFGFGNGSLNTQLVGGTGSINYLLLPGNTQNATGQFNNLQAGTYTVQGTDANGCTKSTVLNITEPAPLTWQPLNINMVSCFGLSNAAVTAPVIGGTGTITYTLQPGNISNTIGAFNNLAAGTYTIQAADANACSLSTLVTFTQPSPFLLSLDSTHNITCYNGTDGFIGTTASGGTLPYTYSIQPALGLNNNGSFSNLPAGTYTVQVVDANACSYSVSPVLLTQPTPIVFTSVTHQDIQCYQDTAGTIQTVSQGGTGTISYSIIPNWGTQTTPGQFLNLPGGTYTIIANDAVGCAATTTVLINQNVQLIISQLNTVSPLCYSDINGSINIVATGGVPPLTYALNAGAAQSTGLFSPLGAATYTITMMDNKGCHFDTVVVLTQPDPLHMPLEIFGAYCENEPDARVVFYPQGGTSPYTFWLNPGNQINMSGVFQNLAPGNYQARLTDAHGCKLDTTLNVPEPIDPLRNTFQQENLGCFGRGNEAWALAIPTGGTMPYTYLWHTSPPQTNAKAEQLRMGYYTVDIVDARGCMLKDTVHIEGGLCCEQVFIPNAFTPNNDGNNDTWHVVTAAGIKILQYEVYNRWGNLLWRGLNPEDAWDGIYQNTLQDGGTYFYQFRYQCLSTGEIFQFNGDITLIR